MQHVMSNMSSVRCSVSAQFMVLEKKTLVWLDDRCFPVTPALFTRVPTVFAGLSSSSEYTELSEPHPGNLFPPREPFLVRQVMCWVLVALLLTALLSPRVIALAIKCRRSAAALRTKVLAYHTGPRATSLQGFTRSTLIAGLAPHLTSQGHGLTAETILTAHYG